MAARALMMANTTDIGSDGARLGQRAEAMLSELGKISSDPNRLVRLFLYTEHRRATDLVASWMRDAGMSVTEDALGTVRGHWRPDLKKRFLIGSHIDTRHRRRQIRWAARRRVRHSGGAGDRSARS